MAAGSAEMGSALRPPRLGWVDIAKGICIIMVVMMHSTLGVEKLVQETSWMGDIVAFAKPFRMPDFFLISGLFLGAAMARPTRSFLDRRVVHFLYFYVVWLSIQFLFKAPGMIAAEGIGAAALAYARALFIEPFGTLWFIWMLPVFALVVRATRRVPVPVPVMLLAGAVLETARIATGHLVIDEFAARFVYFYAGYAFAAAIFAFAAKAGARRGAALVGLGVWAAANGALVWGGLSEWRGVSLLLGTSGALAIVASAALLAETGRAAAPLRFLGERSLVVYLAFFLPMAATRTLLLKTGILPDTGLMALATTAAGVLVPFAIWWICLRLGLRFLFERPAFAHIDGRDDAPPKGERAMAAPLSA